MMMRRARSPRALMTYFPSLDGLRTIAISLVLWQHAGLLFGDAGLDGDAWFWRASRAGWWGVDLFFVLSGLLITRSLLARAPAAPLGPFWRRRAARTLPLLYVYLAVAGAYGLGGGYVVAEQPWLAYLTHTTNLYVARNDFGLPLFGMLWSLGVEEQFYLAWPLVVRWARPRLQAICWALVLAAPAARFVTYQASDCYASFHVLPLCRADALALGALLALRLDAPGGPAALARLARRALGPALGLLAAVTWLGLGPWPLYHYGRELCWVVAGYSLVSFACAALVAWALTDRVVARAALGNPVVAYLGRISYGIYLWHCLLAFVVLSLPWQAGVAERLVAWLALVVAVSSASWFGIERRWLGPYAPAGA
jgi:peptidoglycan/LPS O-acetylase OafA/YrhL